MKYPLKKCPNTKYWMLNIDTKGMGVSTNLS